MTTPNRDDDLHDPRFDAAWREASREEPPPALDAAIRADARRAVGAGPQRGTSAVPEATSPERWWWPLAAAATIGAIAIGLLQLASPGHEAANSTSAIVSDIPAGSAANGTPTPRPERAAPVASPAPLPFPAEAGKREPGEPPAPAGAPTPPSNAPLAAGAAADAAPAPATAAAKSRADAARAREPAAEVPAGQESASIEAQRASVSAGGIAVAPSPADAPPHEPRTSREAAASSGAPALHSGDPAVAAKAQERAGLAVADWITLIRKLIAEGRASDAALELKAFRLAHPDAGTLLPPDLRDWRPPAR